MSKSIIVMNGYQNLCIGSIFQMPSIYMLTKPCGCQTNKKPIARKFSNAQIQKHFQCKNMLFFLMPKSMENKLGTRNDKLND